MGRIKADGTVRYYHADALGSIIALSDANGNVKTTYAYDPFGNTTVSGEASDNPFQYTGRENDGTGLYYYRARYYSPELQRFISEDPIGLKGGVNFYAYVGNNPVNLIDPLGLYNIVPPGGGECPVHYPQDCNKEYADCMRNCGDLHECEDEMGMGEPKNSSCEMGCMARLIACPFQKAAGIGYCKFVWPKLPPPRPTK